MASIPYHWKRKQTREARSNPVGRITQFKSLAITIAAAPSLRIGVYPCVQDSKVNCSSLLKRILSPQNLVLILRQVAKK